MDFPIIRGTNYCMVQSLAARLNSGTKKYQKSILNSIETIVFSLANPHIDRKE